MRSWILLVSMVSLGACDQALSSEVVQTWDILPTMDFTSRAAGTTVDVQLRLADDPDLNTWLHLDGGDRLVARTPSGDYPLELLDEPGVRFTYRTMVPESEGGVFVGVALEREDYESASYSGATLGDANTIHWPLPGMRLSRAHQDLTVRFDRDSASGIVIPTEGPVTFSVGGRCFAGRGWDGLPDLGWFELAAGTLDQGGGDCAAMVELVREGGEFWIDPLFAEGGQMSARQARELRFTSVP